MDYQLEASRCSRRPRRRCWSYLAGFSEVARETIDKFDFDRQITKLNSANLLYLVVSKFCDIDLTVRRFSELSNETAGEHFTPREVIELIVLDEKQLDHVMRSLRASSTTSTRP